MIKFRAMTQHEFYIFEKWSIRNYEKQLIKNENFTPEKALQESKNEFDEMLPNGIESKDNYLYIIQNENKNDIGVIWYQKHLHKEQVAFIGEFIIKKEYRHCGYGKETIKEIEKDAKKKGYCKMELNVFKHNQIAYSLYLKFGYKVIEEYNNTMIMEKIL